MAPDDMPPDVRADLKALSRAILDVLAEMSELAQIPFVPGETVTVSLALTGPVPDLADGQRGVILSIHGEDETRDYPWCLVRLDDGREIGLPQGMLRHA